MPYSERMGFRQKEMAMENGGYLTQMRESVKSISENWSLNDAKDSVCILIGVSHQIAN
jgi:hypothetical protein